MSTSVWLALLATALAGPPFNGPINPPGPNGVPQDVDPSQLGAMADPTPVGVERTNCAMGTVRVPLPDVSLYPLFHGLGDDDLGSTAELNVKARIRHTATRLFVSVEAAASDRRTEQQIITDPSSFSRSKLIIVPVDVPEACEIASVSTTAGRLFDGRTGNAPFKVLPGDGLITKAACRAGADGSDRGKVGCKGIVLEQVEVTLRDRRDNCPEVEIALPAMDHHQLSTLTHGGPDIAGGAGYSYFLDVRAVRKRGGTVDLRMKGIVSESGGDGTKFEKVTERRIFDAKLDAPGCEIQQESRYYGGRRRGRARRSPTYSQYVYPHTGISGRGFAGSPSELGVTYPPRPGGTGLMLSANCVVNTPGADTGRVGCTAIRTRPIVIRLQPKQHHGPRGQPARPKPSAGTTVHSD